MHQLLEAARTTLGMDAACLLETGEHGELVRARVGARLDSDAATRLEVPVFESSGRHFGVLRCMASAARPEMGQAEVQLLHVLARAAALELEEVDRVQVEAEHGALIAVSAAVAAVHSFDEVLEVAAEETRQALGASSVSISRWDREADLLVTLINVGELGPTEDRRPTDEVYRLEEFPRSRRLLEAQAAYIVTADDATVPADQRVLQELGKDSELAVPIVYDGQSWGELEAFSAADMPRFTRSSVRFAEAISVQLSTAIGRAELFSTISELASRDPLTGLANRRAVDQRLDEAIERAVAHGTELSMLFCDLDNLKTINDAGGHEAGDCALRCVAATLESVAGDHPGSFVGRVGGDEFCVVLEGEPVERARELAEELQRRLAADDSSISMSAGASSLAGPDMRAADLYRAADAAQYAAKRAGPGRVVVAGSGEAAERLRERPRRSRRRRLFRNGG